MFDWLWQTALKKSASKGIRAGVASLAGAVPVLQQFGITITVDQAALASAITGALVMVYEFARNWLKSREEIPVNLP